MKKIFVAFACTLFAAGAMAQQPTFGLKGGLNLATFYGDNVHNAKMKPGFYIGGFAEMGINTWLTFAPELVFSTQGTKYDEVNKVKSSNRCNYLNLPIMFKFALLDNLSLDLGPQFGAALSMKQHLKTDGVKSTYKVDSDTRNWFDVSFGMGLSYNVNKNIFVQGRYNLGLNKVSKIDHADNVKNSVIQLGLGYRF